MANVSWLWMNWHDDFGPAPWVDLVPVAVAIRCGLLIGTERQRREKPAGLRTLALVCPGSAIFTMLSFSFTTTTGDSGRVAAQIVTGLGLLGAGVILHGRRMVSGMTTAAIIWVAAAIGMAVAGGYVFAGLGLSLTVNVLLTLVFYETRWHPEFREACLLVTSAARGGLTRIRRERARSRSPDLQRPREVVRGVPRKRAPSRLHVFATPPPF